MNKRMIFASVCGAMALLATGVALRGTFAQDEDVVPTPHEMMMKKLDHANGVLAGLTTNDFDRIAEEARALSLISLEAHWRNDLPPNYAQYNSDFQWAVGGLIQAAELKNLEGATLKYTQVVMNCVECHAAVRGKGQVASLPALRGRNLN